MFACKICSNSYQRLSSLKRHASEKHPLEVEGIIERHVEKKFKCSECSKRFNNKQSFSRHERFTHNIKYVKKNQLCQCALCDFKHYEKSKILSHISVNHNLNVVAEVKEFLCEDDFLEWKANEEITGNCKFIATGGKHKYQKVRNQTFVCNRSQYYMTKVSLKRELKLEAGCKPRSCKSRSHLNAFCPAEIKYSEVDGVYKVKFIETHTHRLDFRHIRLNSSERSDIAKKLSTGIPFNNILDQVRYSLYQGKEIKKKYLLTRKDLLNIEESYSLHGEQQRHKNGELNFETWVREETENNSMPCILFYKPQKQMIPNYPNFNIDDFVLILMNEAQSSILKIFGSDTLCVDSTHELNHDFNLKTFSIIDNSGQGFPCAYLISNRCDSVVSRFFFSKVKERVGNIYATNLMSDMDNASFDDYKSVMPLPKNRLFSSWHVDKAWRKNLSTIESIERQIEVYKILRTMLEEPDENSFFALFSDAKLFFLNNSDTRVFGNYFLTNFEHNMKSWAFCFRSHSGINTNVHLERMCQTIKYIYCSKKKVKHFDDTLYILQKFVRDYLFDSLILHHKEIKINRLNNLKIRHKESVHLDPAIIIEYENKWICSPSSTNSEIFCIQRDNTFEQCNCHIRCSTCNYCIHNFTCTCVDNAMHWNMCKHVHLLCRSRFESDNESNFEDFDISFTDVEDNKLENDIMNTSKNIAIANEQNILKEERGNVLNLFKSIIDDANKEQLEYIKAQVTMIKNKLDDLPK